MSDSIFLSPHNDDETLFGAYTLLRYRPLVVICLRSFVQDAIWKNGVSWKTREAETAAAMDVLGCRWVQWEFSDLEPDWPTLKAELRRLDPTRVWAPAVEKEGHSHHNRIGGLAHELFQSRVVHYLTYTRRGKSASGKRVAAEPGWRELKRRALDCYVSQRNEPRTQAHFERPLDEFYARRPLMPWSRWFSSRLARAVAEAD